MAISDMNAAKPVPAHAKPRLHFTTPEGWLNDPNGLFRIGSIWHLQYQCRWPRAWGHASSTDLVQWENHPVALTPDENGDCWSGATVRDAANTSGLFRQGGLVSIYTSQKENVGQSISLAMSEDDGETWQRPPANPILKGPSKDFRDPRVFWHAPTNTWVMLLTEAAHLTFFASPDLRNWRETGQFVPPLLEEADMLECPDIYPMPVEGKPEQTKWALSVSYVSNVNFQGGFSPRCAVRYFVGEFDGETFHAEGGMDAVLALGEGPDHYATITWERETEGAGRLVGIGWMNHWGYAGHSPVQCMTLPREMTLHENGDGDWRIHQQPARELWQHSHELTCFSRQTLTPEAGPLLLGAGVCGAIRATITPDENGTVEFFLFASDKARTVVSYERSRGVLAFDRRSSGGPDVHPQFPLGKEAALTLLPGQELQIDVLFDGVTVEVFAGDGAAYLSGLVFPEADADRFGVQVLMGACDLKDLQVYQFQ